MKVWTILVFVGAVLLGGWFVYEHRHTPNAWYQYCTARAFGWPFPWRIDNCECDGRGGLTEYPTDTFAWSLGVVVAFGVVTAGSFQMLCRAIRQQAKAS